MRTMVLAMASLGILGPFLSSATADAVRPMEEMHGGCDNFVTPLAEEFALWRQPATALDAGRATPSPTIAVGRRYDITLAPQSEVRFAVPPLEDRGGDKRYAGLLAVVPPKDGALRVSAGTGVWIDLATADALIAASSFEMQTRCDEIFKVITFPVRSGQALTLQFNGSKTATFGLLLSYQPAP